MMKFQNPFKNYRSEFEIACKVMEAMTEEIVNLREKAERLESSGRMLADENEELHAMCKSYEAELEGAYKSISTARACLERVRK